MKKQSIILMLTLFNISLSAQNIQLAKSVGGTGEDRGNSIVVDASGNIYTTGCFNGTADFDPGKGTYNLTSRGSYDIFISKLDASGNFVWAKQLGGSDGDWGNSIAVDKAGNVYSTGFFYVTIGGSMDFDPGTGAFGIKGKGVYDAYILKLNSSGNFVWAKTLGGTGEDFGNSISIDGSGNVYTTGSFNGTADFDPGSNTYNLTSAGNKDIFISKLDTSGNFVWAKNMGGTDIDEAHSIAIDGSNNVYTTGFFIGTSDFDPGTGTFKFTANSYAEVFISKLDASGNFVWAKQIGGKDREFGYGIKVDPFGNVYTTGQFQSPTVDFDPGSGVFNMNFSGNSDVFILKLDSSGNFAWARSMGSKRAVWGFSIAIDELGNVYAGGAFDGSLDFKTGFNTFNLTSTGDFDIYIVKLSATGNFLRSKNIGGTQGDVANSITLDNSGNIYATGYYYGKIDINIGSKKDSLTSIGSTDIFVLSSDNCDADIYSKPKDQIAIIDSNIIFTVASSNNKATYQWQLNSGSGFTNISNGGQFSGATNDTLRISGLKITQNNYKFRCIVKGLRCSDTTNIAILTVFKCNIYTSTQPLNITSMVNTNINFTMASSGNATYQWQQNQGSGFTNISNGGQFSGATNDTLSISSIKLSQNNYKYRCIAKGANCSDTTNSVTLTVKPCDVTINNEPKDLSVNVNTNVKFTMTSLGNATYQWQQNTGSGFTNISNGGQFSGATNDTLSISGVKITQNNYKYRCISKGASCSDTTNIVTLTVSCNIIVTNEPKDLSVNVNSNVKFTMTSSGTATYQWQQNVGSSFANITNGGQFSGATNDTLTISSVKITQSNYKYRCIAKGSSCSDTTNTVTLTVKSCDADVTNEPKDISVTVNTNVKFTMTSSGTVTYQWQQNTGSGFTNISNGGQFSGSTDDTLTISSVKLTQNNYKYRCITKSASCSDTTNTVTLNVKSCDVIINSEPKDLSVNVNTNVKFTMASSGTAAYQWQQNTGSGFSNISNGGQFSGVTNDTLTISGVQISQNNHKFRCIAKGTACSDTTNAAVLTVKTIDIKSLNAKNRFAIYPNPASNLVFIETDNSPVALPYKITDQSGREILNGSLDHKITSVDISKLANGFYFLLVGEMKKKTFKLIKQ